MAPKKVIHSKKGTGMKKKLASKKRAYGKKSKGKRNMKKRTMKRKNMKGGMLFSLKSVEGDEKGKQLRTQQLNILTKIEKKLPLITIRVSFFDSNETANDLYSKLVRNKDKRFEPHPSHTPLLPLEGVGGYQ